MNQDIIQWIEDNSDLHRTVEILYVVDGYEVSVVDDRTNTCNGPHHGATLLEAFQKAMA